MRRNEAGEEPASEEGLRKARGGLFAAGMAYTPRPFQFVERIGEARRMVAGLSACGRRLEPWLQEEMRLRGLRENAAIIAVMEVPEYRDWAAGSFIERYPEREALVLAFADALAQAQDARSRLRSGTADVGEG